MTSLPLTLPVVCQPGDSVVAGSVNGEQPVTVRVTHAVQQSAVSEIRQLVERGLEQRPRVALLAERAAGKGLRIAFENCPMGGNWETGDHNIAFNPDAWELMFDAVPAENLGLEWEPCHQMCQLIDPLPQLREWVGRVFHVHGKDASVHHDAVARRGIHSKDWFAFHRHPGFGDSNWTDIVSELRHGGFSGSIDIEGWHDRVYSGALEMTGQVRALHYLRDCRASFVPNPEAM